MIRDEIMISSEDRYVFDKKQIALAIRNSTFEDELSCSLLVNGILDKCKGCSLKYICDEIDKVAQDYTNKTTQVVSNFSFSSLDKLLSASFKSSESHSSQRKSSKFVSCEGKSFSISP